MQTKFGIFIVLIGVFGAIVGCNMMVTATNYLRTLDPALRFTPLYQEVLSAKNTGNILLDIGVYIVIAGIIVIAWKRHSQRKSIDNLIKTEQIGEML